MGEVEAAKKNMLSDAYTMLESPLNLIENIGSQVLLSGDVMPAEKIPELIAGLTTRRCRRPPRNYLQPSLAWAPWETSPLCPMWSLCSYFSIKYLYCCNILIKGCTRCALLKCSVCIAINIGFNLAKMYYFHYCNVFFTVSRCNICIMLKRCIVLQPFIFFSRKNLETPL